MIEKTKTQKEADITFSYVYMAFCIWIFNMRISFPHLQILFAFINISACFRFPRFFADLIGAFGFVIGPWFFAANAMVFGSVASSSSWEPFHRRAIAALALYYFGNWCLVKKHQKLLDMIKWDPIPPDDTLSVQAQAFSKNRGIINEDGSVQPTPHNIYVDDDLMADI